MPHLADAEPRRLFAELAAKYYAPYPETVVAVTGTNGKTSTVEMTRQIWRMGGHRSASIGTLGVTTSDDQVKTGLTTPDIVTFLNNVAGLKRMGISHVAYEASSHGLDQHRAEGVPLAAAAFTNFSRDHLDYHQTMDAYFEAKMRLFDELLPPGAPAVVWTDDPKSDEVIARATRRGHRLLTVGRSGRPIRLIDQVPTALGQTLTLDHDGTSLPARPAADRCLSGLERADRGRPCPCNRRRVGDHLLGDAAGRAGSRAARTGSDQPRRSPRLHRLCTHPRRSRSRDRRAPSARRGGAA